MTDTGLRSRKQPSSAPASPEENANGAVAAEDETETNKIRDNYLTKTHWIVLLSFGIFIYYCCAEIDAWLPTPLTDVDAGRHWFSEQRARRHLQTLSDFGPKPSGSYACEVLSRNYIVKELEKIKNDVDRRVHLVDVGVQKPSGCFDFDFLSGFMLCYKNITNIVAVLSPGPNGMANHSILVNCHFDSVPSSPGATDDLSSCSIMLEMLNVLSKNPSSWTHNLIFLFNGAEENFMQGAHGFITQHRLRHTIRAFVNLEGAGAGGREFLFQSGPSNMWLLHAYLDSANRPHGSVMAQEIFESGIVLSDTDYRMFRDVGRLSGLDIAYVKNGYLYHTEFDKPEYIPDGSLQRTGENVLATLQTLAHTPCLSRPCPSADDKIVFFDVLGVFVVQYSLIYGVALNLLTCVLIAVKVYHQFKLAKKFSSSSSASKSSSVVVGGYTVGEFVAQLVLHTTCLICIALSTFLLTILIQFMDLTLFWYSQPLLTFPLYIMPLVLIGFWVHLYLPKYFNYFKMNDPFRKEQVTFDVSLSFMALILFAITCFSIRSSYFLLVLTLFPTFRDILRYLFASLFGCTQRSVNLLYICYILSTMPGSVLGCYALVEVLSVFIPMMGRSCSQVNPEILVGGICCLSAIVIVSFLASLAHVSRGVVYLMKCTLALIFLFVILAALTPFGAPYKFDVAGPRWRRLHVQHVRRRILIDNQPPLNENGIWLVTLDYRGVDDLPQQTFLQGAKTPYCLTDDEFCGLPYYLPLRDVIPPSSTLWLSVPNPPSFTKPVSVKLLSKTLYASNKWNYTFSVDGSDHITLSITPAMYWHVDSWTFTSQPLYNEKSYFVYLAHVNVDEPWVFSVVVRTSNVTLMNEKHSKLLLAVGTHEVHGQHQYSDVMKTIVKTVRDHRVEPELTKGHWKWAMTVDGWCNDFLAQYFN